MAVHVPVRISLDPYLVKFLEYHFKEKSMRASRADFIGILLINLMKPAPEGYRPQPNPEPGSVEFRVLDDYDYRRSRSFYIPPDQARDFQTYVQRVFNLVFFSHVTVATAADKLKIKDAILQFRSRYEIDEDDLSFETMKKSFYRMRKTLSGMDDKNHIKNMVATCPFFGAVLDRTLSPL
jgi:hypothetical protein